MFVKLFNTDMKVPTYIAYNKVVYMTEESNADGKVVSHLVIDDGNSGCTLTVYGSNAVVIDSIQETEFAWIASLEE